MSERARIKAILSDLGIHQVDFADEVGCHPAHLCHVLKGKRRPSVDLVKRIHAALMARAVDVNREKLLFDDQPALPHTVEEAG